MTLGLTALPTEVLYQIRDDIVPLVPFRCMVSVPRLEMSNLSPRGWAGGRHPLHALSQACRSIRAICAQSMFFRITLSEYSGLPPRSISCYVWYLRITLADIGGSVGDYIDALRTMPNITTVSWQPRGSAPATCQLLQVLMSLPTLSSFRTRNLSIPTFSLGGTKICCLRELDILQDSRELFTATADDIYSENRALEAMIAPLSSQLEILRIPGESARFSFLAARQWPALQELSIRGGAPRVDAPFAEVVSLMPRLRVLNIVVVRFAGPPLVLFPTTPRLRTALGLLRLTVSDPHPEEGIFSYLDDTLSDLSLRDVPRRYDRRHSPGLHAPGLLLCREAIRIFGTLPLSGASLKRLELAVQEDGAELQLLSMIAASCCNLVLFELHQYRADDLIFMQRRSYEVDLALAPIATILLPLSKLRALRLNFDLGLPTPDPWNPINPESWRPVLAAQAREIANVLPWLNSISFLTTHMLGSAGWNVWDIRPTQDGRLELEHDPLGDESVGDNIRF